jgi:acyl-CoA reductase-like NAD-dependent aldehyde dehydrogenase
LPTGVPNVVVSAGRVVGERLVTHPDAAKIAFTGLTSVGRRIGALASQSIERLTLELAGKSANLIFADADLEASATAAPLAVFGNAGQDCCARSRIFVERSVLDPFLALLERAVKGLRAGNPLVADTQMGPLISAAQHEQVSSYLDGEAPVAFCGSARKRVLVRAHRPVPRIARRPHRPRGDLRSGGGSDPLRRRRRGG